MIRMRKNRLDEPIQIHFKNHSDFVLQKVTFLGPYRKIAIHSLIILNIY